VIGRLKQVANLVLLVMIAGALYTHYVLGDSLDKMTSALIFGLLLICRYIVRYQVNAREARCVKEREEAIRQRGGSEVVGQCTSARCRVDHSKGGGGSTERGQHVPPSTQDGGGVKQFNKKVD